MARATTRQWSQRGRCDHCGRECEISSEWLPRKCPYCGRVHFLPDSRARSMAVYVGLGGVALMTVLAWLLFG